MLRGALGREGIDGASLQRVLGVVARGDADLLAVGIHLKRERIVHSVDGRPEKVTVVTHYAVESVQLHVGLVRVNIHVAAAASSAAPAAEVVMVGCVGTLEWEAASRGNGAAGYGLIRVALGERKEGNETLCDQTRPIVTDDHLTR